TALVIRPTDGAVFTVARNTTAAANVALTSTLELINLDGSLNVLGPIQVGGVATLITGLAYALDSSDQTILVGLDNSAGAHGAAGARLLSVSTANGAATALSEPGTVASVNGLGSFAEPGTTRPLLYATDGASILRGSAVTMPLDPTKGITAVSSITGADF